MQQQHRHSNDDSGSDDGNRCAYTCNASHDSTTAVQILFELSDAKAAIFCVHECAHKEREKTQHGNDHLRHARYTSLIIYLTMLSNALYQSPLCKCPP